MADGPSPGPHRPRVAGLGAGITGLAAAWELERGGADVVVFDPDPVAGGKLRQSDVDELAFPLDDGADAFLARVPDALELCDELGIDDLVHPATGRASVFARRELRPLPASHLLGEENRGFYGIMQGFQNERLVIGAIAVGEAQTALELTLDYVKTRRAFGGRLFDRESVRQRLAMRWAEVAAAREMVYRTAWLDSRGHECVREVSMLKAHSGELLNQVLYDCVQFHGGMGYMRESAIERMYRDARVIPIGGGATEVMLEEVAKRLEDL